MDSKLMSSPFHVPLVRVLRLALGTALFAAVLMIMGASGAFASSQSGAASASTAVGKDKGLLSGIVNPVTDLLDQTLNQVPVVTDITSTDTVGNVVAPVAAVTDQLEGTLAAVPVVDHAITPVRGVTNAVVPPAVQVVGSVVTPTVGAVTQITAPVVRGTAPIVDPVTGTVKPIVDGVIGGTADVVETVVTPIVPGMPEEIVEVPVPNIPSDTPSSQLPTAVGVERILESSASKVSSDGGAAETTLDPVSAAQSVDVSDQPASNALARYMAASALQAFSTSSEVGSAKASASPGSSVSVRLCGSDNTGDTAGPCAPATTTSSASGPSSSLNAGTTGSLVAANEHFWSYFHHAGGAGKLLITDWPLPASMPDNPGSTPG